MAFAITPMLRSLGPGNGRKLASTVGSLLARISAELGMSTETTGHGPTALRTNGVVESHIEISKKSVTVPARLKP